MSFTIIDVVAIAALCLVLGYMFARWRARRPQDDPAGFPFMERKGW
jgi:hypothetical protein